MNKELTGKFMLLGSALIWGSSFVIMKNAVDFLTPHVLLSIRFILSTLFMSLLFFRQLKNIKLSDLRGGFFAGLALFCAFTIQTFGLRLTTPGKNAFLTAIYCTVVPFLSWFWLKKKPDGYQWLAAVLCFVGVGLVSLDSSLNMNIGDIYTLIGGVLYGMHILICEKAMQKTAPIIVTTLQFAFAGIFSLISALLFEDITIIRQIDSSVILQILYLAFFATTVAYIFQNSGQKRVNECTAALILSLESVFGVMFSILLKAEVLNIQIALGFAVIFIAIIISETKLSFLRGRKRNV